MSAITDSARGRECLLRLPGVCCGDAAKTVWAHSNSSRHGKGGALKAHDVFGCYACYDCHMVFDGQYARPAGLTKAMVERLFAVAMVKSQSILIGLGLWDGKTIPARSKGRPAKSKKIPVAGMTPLQRAYLKASA
jgi:hypothetical protein